MNNILFGPKEMNAMPVPQVVVGDDDRERILHTQVSPFQSVCALDLYFAGENNGNPLAGTGALVSPNVVLTCAHNIYAHDYKKQAVKVTAAPGQAALNSKPFGDIHAAKMVMANGFRDTENGEVELDYAALILDTPIGNEAGYFGILEPTKEQLSRHKIHLTGYPSLVDVEWGTAKGMMHDAAGFKDLKDSVIQHYADASPGNSGSPLYFYESNNPDLDPSIVGVHSGGALSQQYNHGAALVGEIFDDVLNWIEMGKAYLDEQEGNA